MYNFSPVLPSHHPLPEVSPSSSQLPASSSSNPPSVAPNPVISTPNSTSVTEIPTSISPPPISELPTSPASACYGVGDDLEGEVQESTTPVEGEEGEEDVPSNVEDEKCFLLPYRQGGFFRPWLPHYFVLTSFSISMYPNEKRYERKKKEIILLLKNNLYVYTSLVKVM